MLFFWLSGSFTRQIFSAFLFKKRLVLQNKSNLSVKILFANFYNYNYVQLTQINIILNYI